MSILVPTLLQGLSSLNTISGGPAHLFLTPKFSTLSLTTTAPPFKTTKIHMGGGPRTFPGGVSKWQWKKMQAKKAKQLLKARLNREREIYEMRKRAELKAAVSELERPWEAVQKAPTLFSVGADEQLKVLADRFQKPGGFDMWSDKDGPELFKPDDGLPSARFFPKGVVHSVKPYGKNEQSDDRYNSGLDSGLENKSEERTPETHEMIGPSEKRLKNNVAKKRRNRRSNLEKIKLKLNGVKFKDSNEEVYDLSLRRDGSI